LSKKKKEEEEENSASQGHKTKHTLSSQWWKREKCYRFYREFRTI